MRRGEESRAWILNKYGVEDTLGTFVALEKVDKGGVFLEDDE